MTCWLGSILALVMKPTSYLEMETWHYFVQHVHSWGLIFQLTGKMILIGELTEFLQPAPWDWPICLRDIGYTNEKLGPMHRRAAIPGWHPGHCCEYTNMFPFFSFIQVSITFLISFCLPLFILYYVFRNYGYISHISYIKYASYLTKGTLGTCSERIRNFPHLASHI